MKTTMAGQLAETAVANKLNSMGYKIIARNWKTTVCEIDIVAEYAGVVYFAEVKYRSNYNSGRGWDYIGPAKLKKIIFASQVWCAHHNYNGDYRLLAAEVNGPTDIINITEIEI